MRITFLTIIVILSWPFSYGSYGVAQSSQLPMLQGCDILALFELSLTELGISRRARQQLLEQLKDRPPEDISRIQQRLNQVAGSSSWLRAQAYRWLPKGKTKDILKVLDILARPEDELIELLLRPAHGPGRLNWHEQQAVEIVLEHRWNRLRMARSIAAFRQFMKKINLMDIVDELNRHEHSRFVNPMFSSESEQMAHRQLIRRRFLEDYLEELSINGQSRIAEILLKSEAVDKLIVTLNEQRAALKADLEHQLAGLQRMDIRFRLQRIENFLKLLTENSARWRKEFEKDPLNFKLNFWERWLVIPGHKVRKFGEWVIIGLVTAAAVSWGLEKYYAKPPYEAPENEPFIAPIDDLIPQNLNEDDSFKEELHKKIEEHRPGNLDQLDQLLNEFRQL